MTAVPGPSRPRHLRPVTDEHRNVAQLCRVDPATGLVTLDLSADVVSSLADAFWVEGIHHPDRQAGRDLCRVGLALDVDVAAARAEAGKISTADAAYVRHPSARPATLAGGS